MKKILSFFIIILLSNQLIGQTNESLNKEVEVVKPYKPTIRETIKISDMPRFQPQDTEKPDFNYNVHQQAEIAPNNTDTIRATRIISEPVKQGIGLIRIGVGNYQLPYGELFLNRQIGNATNIGLNFSHLNSVGKITLRNDDRVEAPSSETSAELYLNHYFEKVTAQGRLYFDRQAFRYYGYTGEKLSDDEKRVQMPWWDYKQAFPTLGFEVNIDGKTELQNNFKYNGSINIQHFETATGQKEGLFKLAGQLEQDFRYFDGRLNFAVIHVSTDSIYNTTSNYYEKRSQTYIEVRPSIGISSESASIRAGINSIIGVDPDNNVDILQTPMVDASWTPIKNKLTLFSEISGYMKYNHYSAIAAENRYVNPYHDIKGTKYQFIINGGIRGRLDQSFGYNLKAEFASIKNHNFYFLQNQEVQDANSNIIESVKNNTFDLLYDNINQFSIGAEILYNWENEWSMLLKATHYIYDSYKQPEVWNLPNFEASLSFRYNMPVEPLRFTADINYIGKRKGLEQTDRYNSVTQETTTSSIIWDLPAIVDISVGAEYKFSNWLSFWAKVNNMTTDKYEKWQGYTNKRLNFIVGLSFSF